MRRAALIFLVIVGDILQCHVSGFVVGHGYLGTPNSRVQNQAKGAEVPAASSRGFVKPKDNLPLGAGNMNPMSPDKTKVEVKSETKCFDGKLIRCTHHSESTKTPMTFTVFLPPTATSDAPAPVRFANVLRRRFRSLV